MMINKATKDDFDTVKEITQRTIRAIYPHYYPKGAVVFFCAHHSDEKIMKDITDGNVYVLEDEGNIVGTVTVNNNEINRLFVLPEAQHRGYGRSLMDFAENKVLEFYDEICLDASLPAKSIYLKRGFVEKEYHIIDTPDGDHLCYDFMKKSVE